MKAPLWWRLKTWFQLRVLKRAYFYTWYKAPKLVPPVVKLEDYNADIIKHYAEKPLNPLLYGTLELKPRAKKPLDK